MAERVAVRDITNEEGRKLLSIVRRGSGHLHVGLEDWAGPVPPPMRMQFLEHRPFVLRSAARF